MRFQGQPPAGRQLKVGRQFKNKRSVLAALATESGGCCRAEMITGRARVSVE